MPSHVPMPRHDPPTYWDRTRIHASEVGLAVLAITTALQVLATPLFREYAPSISLKAIDPELGLALAVFLGAGGTLALFGVLWSGNKVSTGWLLEQVGCLLIACGWLGYGALVAYSFPFSTIGYTIAFALGIMAAFRAYVVRSIERAIRPGAEVAKKLREGGGGK